MAETFLNRTLVQRRQALTNLVDFLTSRGIADTSETPCTVIDTGRTRTLKRYRPTGELSGAPVLMVPPLGAQAKCFDLRRGCSLAEHLVERGRPTYLVDYGAPGFAERGLGLEHYVNDVLAPTVYKVSADAGGQPVNLVGWCMGGLLSILAAAARPELPIRTISLVASPFDFSKIPIFRPLQLAAQVTGGRVVAGLIKASGGPTALVTELGFKATAIPTYLKKPLTIWRRRDDQDFLAQVQAVDELMNNMVAYPGRATLQVYMRVAVRNELASGEIQGPTKLVKLSDVRIPIMNVAGSGDVLAPPAAAHHVGELVPNSPDVRLPTAPGGHLGVLTGAKAASITWVHIDEFIDAHAV